MALLSCTYTVHTQAKENWHSDHGTRTTEWPPVEYAVCHSESNGSDSASCMLLSHRAASAKANSVGISGQLGMHLGQFGSAAS